MLHGGDISTIVQLLRGVIGVDVCAVYGVYVDPCWALDGPSYRCCAFGRGDILRCVCVCVYVCVYVCVTGAYKCCVMCYVYVRVCM